MVGRGFLSLLGAAVVLGFSAPGALADEGQRLVMVEHSPFMIQQLESKGYDVGFIGEKYEAAVYVDAAERGEAARPRATRSARRRGRQHVAGPQGARSPRRREARRWRAVRAERHPASRRHAQRQAIVAVPGDLVIMRAYTFTNYAGPLPLRRGAQQGAHRQQRPDDVAVVRRCRRRVPEHGQPEQQHHQPRRRRPGSAATRSPTATPARLHVPPRRWSPCAATTPTRRAADVVDLRSASLTPVGNNDTSRAVEWAGEGLPPRVAGFQKDFITKYMDPTEIYARMDAAHRRSSRTSARPSSCRNKTDGYQRPGMAMMAGTTAPNANPNTANTAFAVQLFSKAMGHLGGNNITAEFKNPGVPDSPLSITVDRRHLDASTTRTTATRAMASP